MTGHQKSDVAAIALDATMQGRQVIHEWLRWTSGHHHGNRGGLGRAHALALAERAAKVLVNDFAGGTAPNCDCVATSDGDRGLGHHCTVTGEHAVLFIGDD